MGLPQRLMSILRQASPLAVLLVGLIAAFASPAHADALAKPTSALAREHLTTGNRYYRVRDFEKAIVEYKAGAVREDAAVFHYNLGQCYRQLGKYEDAIWHYKRFIDHGKPTGEVEASVTQFIAQMKGELARTPTKPPPVAPAPSPTTQPANAVLTPPSLPVDSTPRGIPLQRRLAVGIGVAGIAVIGAGIVWGARAESFESDADEICPMSVCDRAMEATELIDRGKQNALYANVSFGLGGAAVIGAVVLWITGGSRERNPTAIVPHASRSFTGLAATLTF